MQKKINVCRLIELYKFVCKLRASSVQVRARAMQNLCMFLCNAFVVHVPKEEFVNFIVRASELREYVQHNSVAHFHATLVLFFASFTCTHLVQATYVASDWGIGHARANHHAHTPKQTQHTAMNLPPDHVRCPPCQTLGTK